MSEPAVLLAGGARYRWPDGPSVTLHLIDAAALSLPTGSVALVDPAAHPWELSNVSSAAEFDARSATLRLTIAAPAPGEVGAASAVAAAGLVQDGTEASVWRRAVSDAGEPVRLSVDSGMGSFADLSLIDRLVEIQDDPDLDEELTQVAIQKRWSGYPSDASTYEAVRFICGMGDGVYDCWHGFDRGGSLVAILCDLELLDHLVAVD